MRRKVRNLTRNGKYTPNTYYHVEHIIFVVEREFARVAAVVEKTSKEQLCSYGHEASKHSKSVVAFSHYFIKPLKDVNLLCFKEPPKSNLLQFVSMFHTKHVICTCN